jgi:hypothetical protein
MSHSKGKTRPYSTVQKDGQVMNRRITTTANFIVKYSIQNNTKRMTIIIYCIQFTNEFSTRKKNPQYLVILMGNNESLNRTTTNAGTYLEVY